VHLCVSLLRPIVLLPSRNVKADDVCFGPKDDQWSSIVVLPSGLVQNAQIVQNDSGRHNRLKAIDTEARTVTMSILDGVQGGKQYFYHLVTDASDAVPAVLEKGVFAPKLAKNCAVRKILAGGKVGST
jgi:hypothetical protein